MSVSTEKEKVMDNEIRLLKQALSRVTRRLTEVERFLKVQFCKRLRINWNDLF